jgi:hypothetical protein
MRPVDPNHKDDWDSAQRAIHNQSKSFQFEDVTPVLWIGSTLGMAVLALGCWEYSGETLSDRTH